MRPIWSVRAPTVRLRVGLYSTRQDSANAGSRAARGLAANDLMYWEVMRRAGRDRGATMFDFGRSKAGTGAFAFKKNWGFAPQELHYCYRLGPGAQVPDNNPNNPKYRLLIAAWKRLPLAVANLIGPRLVRGLG